jgi:hypothetical protein
MMAIPNHHRTNGGLARSLSHSTTGEKPQHSSVKRTRIDQAEAIDEKIKSALRRARGLIFRSPYWPTEFERSELI